MEAMNDNNENTALKSKFMSVQNLAKPSEDNLRPQISAPFYLHCFTENKAPPFKKLVREIRPRLLIGTIVEEIDIVDIIQSLESKSETQCIGDYLVKKNIVYRFRFTEKMHLVSLFKEIINYAAQRDFSAFKLACLLTIYLNTHKYFKGYYWIPPKEIWNYFKEIMIRHTIEDSPDGQEVFTPEECYDIMTHFHTIYLSNLPLVHMLTFGTHRLKMVWPF